MSADTLNAAINLRLALLELPRAEAEDGKIELVEPLLARQRELSRRLADRLCPVDQRIQDFLDDYLADVDVKPRLPKQTLILDQAGLARGLSLPADGDEFHSPLLSSYRLSNGVLHNPANDRRTTAGVFHIAEGGLPGLAAGESLRIMVTVTAPNGEAYLMEGMRTRYAPNAIP